MIDDDVIIEFFNYVDIDKDGFITIEEIKTACQVDINQDGIITEDERLQCARIWIEKLPLQDKNNDNKLSLEELLNYNKIILL